MSRSNSIWFGCSVFLAATLFAGSAPLAADQSGFQVDLKHGRSTLDDTFGRRFVKSFDDEAASSSVEIGYFFNDYVGVQVGYHDLGTFDGGGSPCPDDVEGCIEALSEEILALCADQAPCVAVFAPIEAEVTGWSLAVVPSWPFTSRLSAFGKVGVLEWDTDLSSTLQLTSAGREFERFSNTDLLTGIGLNYRIGKNLGASVEYRRLDLDLASASLGVNWRF